MQISIATLCQHSTRGVVTPQPPSRCHGACQGSPLPKPTPVPRIPHRTPDRGTVCPIFSLLLAHASPLSLSLPMVEACLETQAGNGFSGALCGAFLSWVASAAPPHREELPGLGLCLLSFRKLSAPGQPSLLTRHGGRPPKSKTPSALCNQQVGSRAIGNQLEQEVGRCCTCARQITAPEAGGVAGCCQPVVTKPRGA